MNEVIGKSLKSITDNYNLIWQTGKTGVPASVNQDVLQSAVRDRHLAVHDFVDDMPSAYSIADLAICRAGAMTLAELAAAGVPAVLIPYPYATDDHQTVNAQSVVDSGGAIRIRDDELSDVTLLSAITSCLQYPQVHKNMSQAMKSLDRPRAALEIAGITLRAAKDRA